jgi:homoserine dehydrogenase
MMAADEPGVLATIAAIFARYTISISSVLQKELAKEEQKESAVPVVITTHPALSSAVSKALVEVDALEVISGTSVCISILDEHPEYSVC